MDIPRLLEDILPKERVKASLIDLVASASDAGFYYMRPKAVVLPVNETEIQKLFHFSKQHQVPLVFRAAGTSLSGQSVTDGILVDLSQHWRKISIEDNGGSVRVQPGAIGAIVNTYLKKYGKKIGPDPASINSAMMGGIISNNSSGMCCGVAKNSYHTIKHISFILPDGKQFSTENQADYSRFDAECEVLAEQLKSMRSQLIGNPELQAIIRKKYKTKNTVGYAVNAFLDFEHPLDILGHLLVGAEGTLGFIAEAVMNTVPDYKAKSTAMLYFPSIYSACQAIVPLTQSGAEAVELMDRASLRSIEHTPGMPAIIKELPQSAAALLVEFQADTAEEVEAKIGQFMEVAAQLDLLNEVKFTVNPVEQALLWKVRKGLFPAVGAVRASGTTVILEDIAFPVATLGDAILDLHRLFEKYHYQNAIIFGHAKDGNIHFVVTQAFDTPAEIERYDRFIREVVSLVVDKYQGTLKAEHGTGRNMAPFVETEWGPEIYEIMKAVKLLVDPENLLNPGVIINHDKAAHIRNLKDLPQVEEEVDRCMECGFCEHKCPSRDVTLTPRKRIVVRREITKLKLQGNFKQYNELVEQYQYPGLDTCAVDGLCATACPVDINTGELVKRLRKENHSGVANSLALFTAKNFKVVAALVKTALYMGVTFNKVFGVNTMKNLTAGIKKVVPAFPLWSNQLAVAPSLPKLNKSTGLADAVVYFPACINRVMGEAHKGQKTVMQTFLDVSARAEIQVIIPQGLGGLCCGQIYSSKGFSDSHAFTVNQTVSHLWETTQQGKHAIVLDISSCTQTLRNCRGKLTDENKAKYDAMRILDSIEYVQEYIIPKTPVVSKKSNIMLHPVCSLTKMGLENAFSVVAGHYAEKVTVPVHAGCCGMAGDRGFLFPELTRAATHLEAHDARNEPCSGYYSSSKTCEIALSDAVQKNYQSILTLVDECTAPVK
ncbi:FAD-binding and (Fe-S)-binding domain-containing protein [Mucilaginibacter sp. PAMB04168]|uniref:FAD-binding and (Fe-S)-binding domain-containing protein n=1 Tax=Mucilaginibacter sp. PAMB04168 TaxID=3138567 RepID=UPI0031F6DD8E